MLKIRMENDDMASLNRLGEFRLLHGFAEAEAVILDRSGSRILLKDYQEYDVPCNVVEMIEQGRLAPLLEQLESSCPGACAGCQGRVRAEIVVEME